MTTNNNVVEIAEIKEETKTISMEEVMEKSKSWGKKAIASVKEARNVTINKTGKAAAVVCATVKKEHDECVAEWKNGWAEGWDSVMNAK